MGYYDRINYLIKSRDSAVGKAGLEFKSRWGQEFSTHHVVQPPIQWVPGALSSGGKLTTYL
jgi:hypothetical protein